MWMRYAISLAVMIITVGLKRLNDVWGGPAIPFFFFFLPLLMIAWFAGFGPSIASALSVIAIAQYVPLSPNYSLGVSIGAAERIAMFLGQSLIICWLTASRRGAYRRVHNAERQFHTLADSIPQLVWISNCDGHTVYHNHRLFEYTGLYPEESIAHWEQIVHPEDREGAVAAWRESLRTGKPYDIQYRLRNRDGSYLWFLGRATPLRDRDGKIIVWFGTATDIEHERQAVEDQARLAAIVESTEDAIIGGLPDGTITSWNKGAEELFGYTHTEMVGRRAFDLVPPDRMEELRQIMVKINRGERVGQFETVRVRKDGRQVHVCVTVSPIRDAQGRVVGACVVGHDITARKQMEAELQEREAESRAMFELAGIGQAQAEDTQTRRFTRVNQRFCEITGYSEAELLNLSAQDITHPDDRQADSASIRSVTMGKTPHWFSEKRYICKDGSVIYVEVNGTVVRDADGKPWRTIACIQDVTSRKLAEQALRDREERFRIVANTAPVSIWIRNALGRCAFLNKTFVEFLGITLQDALGQGWIDFVHPTDEPHYRDRLLSAVASHKPYQVEYRLRRADGQFRWVIESAVPWLSTDGCFEGFIGSCVDITERKWAEQTLRGANVELELQIADSQNELESVQRALLSERTQRERAEHTLKKLGQP
jgi:PAS domain S-box-containing protein